MTIKQTISGIIAVLAMLTIWCTWNSVNINTMIKEHHEINKVVNNLTIEYQQEQEQEEEEEDISWEESFNDAFAKARAEQGSGGVFVWEEEYYTTDYYEESFIQAESNVNGWVLNSDDIDDYCKSNNHDECGVCDGSGATTWYADRDGDGLGDASTFSKSCDSPVASK